MGAIAEALVAFAQPLLDQTDGSMEQMNKAFSISQLCYNLALLPEEDRDQCLNDMRSSLEMSDEEFNDFRSSVIDPMLRRHKEMFPPMHRRDSNNVSPGRPSPNGPSLLSHPRMAASTEAYPGTDPYALCPCKSGRKYKFCCRKKDL